jgi:hypothetical protein
MKKKAFLILVVLIAAGFKAYALPAEETFFVEKVVFSKPFIEEHDEYVSVTVKGANTCLLEVGKPILPAFRRTFTFPFGTKINSVSVSIPSQVQKERLAKNVVSAPEPLPPYHTSVVCQKQGVSNDFYPKTWFEYTVGCGLYQGKHSVILTLVVYPVRYAGDMIYYIPEAEIKITYEEPSSSNNKGSFDLIIITPAKFSDILQPLVVHKESLGISTKLVTLDDVYKGTFFPCVGRDDAEKVKYFIKNALDEWGIKYVLLVGGRKPGVKETWFVPVRYVNVFWIDENSYLCDLYFADIYNGEGNFSTWDTDGNNVFSEWKKMSSLADEIDLYPDVHLGRLACRNRFEVWVMVNKIIKYENSRYRKRVVLAGGDDFEEGPEFEGEVVCDKTIEYLPGFEAACVYASETDVNPENIKKALGDGAVFMHLQGHGNPIKWGTHKPYTFDEWEEGLDIYDLYIFFNSEYPVVVIGGCHTAMFNVSLTNRLYTYTYLPTPEGISWWFTRKYFGGGIAALGYTCYPVAAAGEYGDLDGDGNNELDCIESGYGYMQLQLFYGYSGKDLRHVGECWGYTVSNYVEHYKLPYQRHHLHTIQGFVLLGDPSLKIN